MDVDTKQAFKEGMKEAIIEILRDAEAIEAFWASGFNHLSKTAQDRATSWIGRQFLIWVGGLVLAVSIFLATKTGYLK